jgi:hypothetical protein
MRIRWMVLLAVMAGLGRGAAALVQEPDTSELLKTADAMVQTAARLRGLEPKAPISKGVKSREEISKYLEERLKKEHDREQLQLEGKLLQKLGIIPATVDYKDLILKLFAEQVAGFYDPEEKTYFIASWLPLDEQKPAMIHELTHALQDQYFDIKDILEADRKLNNDDREMAHEALMEGDAMAAMLNYQFAPAKRHFADLPNLAFLMKLLMSEMQEASPVLKSAPAFIQQTLLFSYGYGSSFLQQAWKQHPSWQTVNKMYSDLPASTEQIMHPEKYYADRDEPKTVHAEDLAAKLGDRWKIAYKNVLGEFSLGLVLNLHLNDERAKSAATGWGGDQVLLLENGAGKDVVLIDTIWDTSDDSEKFFAAMDEWFLQHFPKAVRAHKGRTGFSLVQDGEFSSLRREGTAVRFIVGLPNSEAKKLPEFLNPAAGKKKSASPAATRH